jgi:hypothetical protein
VQNVFFKVFFFVGFKLLFGFHFKTATGNNITRLGIPRRRRTAVDHGMMMWCNACMMVDCGAGHPALLQDTTRRSTRPSIISNDRSMAKKMAARSSNNYLPIYMCIRSHMVRQTLKLLNNLVKYMKPHCK